MTRLGQMVANPTDPGGRSAAPGAGRRRPRDAAVYRYKTDEVTIPPPNGKPPDRCVPGRGAEREQCTKELRMSAGSAAAVAASPPPERKQSAKASITILQDQGDARPGPGALRVELQLDDGVIVEPSLEVRARPHSRRAAAAGPDPRPVRGRPPRSPKSAPGARSPDSEVKILALGTVNDVTRCSAICSPPAPPRLSGQAAEP